MADPTDLEGMRAVRLANDQVEVRRARSKIFAGVFGGAPKATMVGRFEVRDRLGSGGMGIVYEAYDPQLERRVALKVLRADATLAADGAARLVEEARAMAKLSHPNVLTVYEAGTVDEQVFIAMALVEGYTLRSWLAAETRSSEAVMDAMRAAGRGLVAAHEAGLVHRDFKPENVLVSAAGEVFVTDFGLARSYSNAESGAWRRASSGVLTTRMAGTPAYMAPEQLRSQHIDARCDQFAWCVTAYEALLGQRPFDEANLQRLALEPTFVPDAPSIPASLPWRVRAALERGLSIDREDRYDSLSDLLDAVRPRRRAWAPITAGLGVAAVGLGAAAMMQRDPCPPAPERLAGVWDDPTRAAVAQAFAATSMPYAERARAEVEARADRFVEQWVSLHQRACREDDARLAACLNRRKDAFGAVARLLEDADAGVVERAVAMVTALPAVGECSDPDGALEPDAGDPRLDDARAQLQAARLADARSTVDELLASLEEGAPQWLDASTLQGEIALARGDAEASTAAFERVLDRASGELGQLATAKAAVGLLEVQATLAKTDFEASKMLARTAKIAVASAGNPPRLRTRLESANAGLEIAQGNFDAGIAKVERAQALLAELGDDTLLERGRLMLLAAQALFRKQQLDEAARLGDGALEIFRDILGSAHPQVGRALLLPGSIALVRGDVQAAEKAYRNAADVLGASVGRSHADYATAVVSLANVARARGDYAQARTLTAEALAVMEEVYPADNMRLLAVRSNLASLEHALGNLDAARSAYLETLEVQRKALGEHHDVSVTLANLARVEQERGADEAAQQAAEQALAIRRQVFGETHERTLGARLLVAEIQLIRRVSPEDVLAEVAEIRSLREATLGLDHPTTLEAVLIQAKAALRSGDAASALRHAEETLKRRQKTKRPAGELLAAQVLVAQAAAASGKVDRAREVAASISFDGQPASELRGWCERCEDEMRALASAG